MFAGKRFALCVVFSSLLLLFLAGSALAADAPAAFNQCKACHKVEAGKNGVGPSLFGVVGRTAGNAAGYKYSVAMTTSGLVWNEANLNMYLTNPKATVPGNKMPFPGLKKPDDVNAVVQYLNTLK